MSGETARWNKADATTPAYGHPSSPEEGSYNYLAAEHLAEIQTLCC